MAKSDPHSLTNLLASLTRSQYGAATAQMADDQLDRHVAQLLLDEAKSASATWGSRTSSPSTQLPRAKTTSRFLTNILKGVEGHNDSLRRADEDKAREREREEQRAASDWREQGRGQMRGWDEEERGTQRDRGEGSSKSYDRASRLHHDEDDRSRSSSHRDSRAKETTEERRERHRLDDDRDSARTSRSKGTSPERRERHRSRDEGRDGSHRSKETSEERKERRRLRAIAEDQEDDARRERRAKRRARGDEEDAQEVGWGAEVEGISIKGGDEREAKRSRPAIPTPTILPLSSLSTLRAPLPPLPPPPPPPPPSTSKMDRLFHPSYDPALDVLPTSYAPTVIPDTGLVPETNFENWNSMLSLLAERKLEKKLKGIEDKSERKREREKVREERRKREDSRGGLMETKYDREVVELERERERKKEGLLAMEGYAKKGGVRAWDVGK